MGTAKTGRGQAHFTRGPQQVLRELAQSGSQRLSKLSPRRPARMGPMTRRMQLKLNRNKDKRDKEKEGSDESG